MDTISKTLKHGDFDTVFREVNQPEQVDWTTEGELRLFHLKIRNNKIETEDLKTFIYLCIGDYVFSRAKMERFEKSGNKEAIISQAQKALKKNGGADAVGSGGELGEVMDYILMEEKLGAPKLMSRVELDADGKQYGSSCDGIYLLPQSVTGLPYHQVVFGSSNVTGDLEDAINGAFDKISSIEANTHNEIRMVHQLAFDRLATDEEVALVKDILIPSPNKLSTYNTSYGVFLGYTLGLGSDHPVGEFESLAEQKMQDDIKHYISHILQKIKSLGLGSHSFYFYVVPFQDAETDKKAIMEAVLEGDIDLI